MLYLEALKKQESTILLKNRLEKIKIEVEINEIEMN